MTLKIAVLALALFTAWLVLFRPRRRPPAPREPEPRPAALESCPRCGVYRLPGGRCECDAASPEGR